MPYHRPIHVYGPWDTYENRVEAVIFARGFIRRCIHCNAIQTAPERTLCDL